MQKSQSQYDEFLQELTELSKKHGIYIGGCGCCGSPFLLESDEPDLESELHSGAGLQWKKGRYV